MKYTIKPTTRLKKTVLHTSNLGMKIIVIAARADNEVYDIAAQRHKE